MKTHILNKVALVVGGICIGSGVTYLVTSKRLENKYREFAHMEIEGAKEYYKLLRKEPPYDDPKTALAAYSERIDELEYYHQHGVPEVMEEPAIYNELATGETEVVDSPDDYEVDLTAITTNETVEEFKERHISDVLKRAQENMNKTVIVNPPTQAQKVITLDDVTSSPADISELVTGNIFETIKEPSPLEMRDPNFPYIISIQEWVTTHQDDYAKTTLTYYTGGKKPELADDNGHLLPNLKYLLGTDAVNHFGYDEDNPQTVFVRNDALKADFEVILDTRSYAEAELGIESGD